MPFTDAMAKRIVFTAVEYEEFPEDFEEIEDEE